MEIFILLNMKCAMNNELYSVTLYSVNKYVRALVYLRYNLLKALFYLLLCKNFCLNLVNVECKYNLLCIATSKSVN